MKNIMLTLFWLLISVAALAQSYSNANLNGSYSFQLGNPTTNTWSKTFTCPTNSTVQQAYSASITTTQDTLGIVTFDGAGNFTFSATNTGKMNATASANTMSVKWNSSCQVTSVNYGHIVYLAASTQTGNGTYSVQSNGSGTLAVTGQKNSGTTFQLAATDNAGISHTALLTGTQTNGLSIATGIAVRE